MALILTPPMQDPPLSFLCGTRKDRTSPFFFWRAEWGSFSRPPPPAGRRASLPPPFAWRFNAFPHARAFFFFFCKKTLTDKLVPFFPSPKGAVRDFFPERLFFFFSFLREHGAGGRHSPPSFFFFSSLEIQERMESAKTRPRGKILFPLFPLLGLLFNELMISLSPFPFLSAGSNGTARRARFPPPPLLWEGFFSFFFPPLSADISKIPSLNLSRAFLLPFTQHRLLSLASPLFLAPGRQSS